MKDSSAHLAYAKNIGQHLVELSELIARPVQRNELLSLEQTNEIRARSKASPKQEPFWRETLRFSEKSTPAFRRFIAEMIALNSSPVHLWTELSNICGLLPPVPLAQVNFAFGFDLIPSGILVIETLDFFDRMLLDWGEGNSVQTLEVEIGGAHWGRARYRAIDD